MRISAIVLAVTSVVAVTITVPPIAVAAENSTLQCTSAAPIFRMHTTGEFFYDQHGEPETGADNAFMPFPPRIDVGWQDGHPVAGLDGTIYAAWNDGALRRYRWNGAGWDTFPGGGQYEIIDPTGWERYRTPAYKNRITVDAEGHFYTIEPDGNLHWRAYDATTRTWRHRAIDGDWNQFDLIVASGRGVLYARTPAGLFFRYRYHADSQRWLMYGKQIGTGYDILDRIVSVGGDVFYGVVPDGRVFWYRWDENTEAYVPKPARTSPRAGSSTGPAPASPTPANGSAPASRHARARRRDALSRCSSRATTTSTSATSTPKDERPTPKPPTCPATPPSRSPRSPASPPPQPPPP
jgi:hypothetical protein